MTVSAFRIVGVAEDSSDTENARIGGVTLTENTDVAVSATGPSPASAVIRDTPAGWFLNAALNSSRRSEVRSLVVSVSATVFFRGFVLAVILTYWNLVFACQNEAGCSRWRDYGNAQAAALKDGKDSFNEVGKFRFVVVETELYSIDTGSMQTLELISHLFRTTNYLNVTT